jgi:hypothetical protein
MRYFYSKSHKGFFIEGVNSFIPEDCLEITEERYHDLLEQQSLGKQITPDENGLPMLVDRLQWPDEMMASIVRNERDNYLRESDWSQGNDIPDALKTIWAVYRQQLRDVPQQPGFPQNVVWPEKPV